LDVSGLRLPLEDFSWGLGKLRDCPCGLVRWHKVISRLFERGSGLAVADLVLLLGRKRNDGGYIRNKKNLSAGEASVRQAAFVCALCDMVNGKTHDIMFLQIHFFCCRIEFPKK
jgi:hypothetical protein